MTVPTQSRCGYCNAQIDRDAWKHSPHGRPYCPHCKAIPSKYQRSNGYKDDLGKSNLRAVADKQ